MRGRELPLSGHSQVRLGFRPGWEQDPADLIFYVIYSFPHLWKQGLPDPSPTLLFTHTPPTP